MKRYTLLYCLYDPDNYRGHRVHDFEAKDETSARALVKEFLERLPTTEQVEFRLIEQASTSSYRCWAPGAGSGKGNDYQDRTYFNVED